MANSFSALGLQTATRAELISYFNTQFLAIYGADINLDSDTPDGQWIAIIVQSILDLQDLLVQVYNSFDPDLAIGNVLDQRVAINGIQRQAGTYTLTPVTIVNTQSVNLYGIDQTEQDIYTVADNAGNQWLLTTTELGLAAGSNVLNFRAATPGANQTVPNTITVPVTIVLGVASVNNPTTYTTLGINEESDAALRLRRQKSVSLSSQGYLAGLLAALENINGVTSAFVYENNTDATDSDGVPSHSIWVIVAGTADDADIAQAIYTKRNAGCGMFGAVSYDITQIDGTLFPVYWDTVVVQALFIAFTVTPLDGVTPVDIAAIRAGLVESLVPAVNASVNINQLATLVQELDSNALVTSAGFSPGTTQVLTLSGVPASGAFTLSFNGNATTSLNWNDSAGTIQTALRLLAGLSTVVVTGTLASQTLTLDLTGEDYIDALVYAATNTLQTVAPAAITFSYNEGYANTLAPTAKTDQFVVTAANIVILAMQLTPPVNSAVVSTDITFVALGGYGSYTYSILTNNSGASIGATTGIYTAGTTPSVTDTVKAVDRFGNTATATVSVLSA